VASKELPFRHAPVLNRPGICYLPCCSAPSVTASPSGATAGVAFVTPPANNRPWASYDLRVCVNGTTECRTIACTAVSGADAVTTCSIPNCVPATRYTVTAVAQQTNFTSAASQPVDFITDNYP